MINEFSKEALALLQKQNTDMLIWGLPPDTRTEEKKFEDELKFSIVKVGDRQHMVYMHPETMKAYVMKPYEEGAYPYILQTPIEEMKDYEFIRWARPMDF